MSTASVTTSESGQPLGSPQPRDEGEIVSETSSPRDDTETTRQRRPERRVDTDPRTTGFIIGRNHANLKTLGADLKAQYGESVFIKYIQPPGKQWGFWKVLSRSEDALEAASKWIREKEQECHRAIASGTYEPRAPRLENSRDRSHPRDYDSSRHHPRDYDSSRHHPRDYDSSRHHPRVYDSSHHHPRDYDSSRHHPRDYERPPYNQRQGHPRDYERPRYNQRQGHPRDYDGSHPRDYGRPRYNQRQGHPRNSGD